MVGNVIHFSLNQDDDIFLDHGSHSRLPSISEESNISGSEKQKTLPVIVPVAATPEPEDQASEVMRNMVRDKDIITLQKDVSTVYRYSI